MKQIAAFVRIFMTLLLAGVVWIGARISGEPSVASGGMQITRSLAYSIASGASFNQGLASDGTYFYGTGAFKPVNYNAITKIDAATGEIVQRSEQCLPRSLLRAGYSHLGDCCLYDGRLYIAIEDYGFRNPGVAEYDPQTLEFLDFHAVPAQCRGNGRIPWCAVADGVLYFSQSNNVTEIRMLDVRDFSFLGALQIDTELFKVQGGEVLDGKLYMVTNTGTREKTMTAIDLATGHAEPVFVRCTGKIDAEGEGIAICPLSDGSLFHILDAGIQVRITSFKPTNG